MSGVISFSADLEWIKARWVYWIALEGICAALLKMEDTEGLRDELLDASGTAQVVLWVRTDDWPREKKELFARALKLASTTFQEEGPANWGDPSAFPKFMAAMEDLVTMAEKQVDRRNP